MEKQLDKELDKLRDKNSKPLPRENKPKLAPTSVQKRIILQKQSKDELKQPSSVYLEKLKDQTQTNSKKPEQSQQNLKKAVKNIENTKSRQANSTLTYSKTLILGASKHSSF